MFVEDANGSSKKMRVDEEMVKRHCVVIHSIRVLIYVQSDLAVVRICNYHSMMSFANLDLSVFKKIQEQCSRTLVRRMLKRSG